jgi:hypothetical protein
MIARAGALLVRVHCDRCDCVDPKHVAWSAAEARDELRVLHGWTHGPDGDRCPACAAPGRLDSLAPILT